MIQHLLYRPAPKGTMILTTADMTLALKPVKKLRLTGQADQFCCRHAEAVLHTRMGGFSTRDARIYTYNVPSSPDVILLGP